MSKSDRDKLLRRARTALFTLCWKHPFFSMPAAKIRIVVDTSVPTACVDIRGRVTLNPDFCLQLSKAELRGILAHEMAHLLTHYWARLGSRIPLLWNIACFPAGVPLGNGLPIEAPHTSIPSLEGPVDIRARMERPYCGDVVRVRAAGVDVRATTEHPFLVYRRARRGYPIKLGDPEWITAADLRPGDYLLSPAPPPQTETRSIPLDTYSRDGVDGKGRRTFQNRRVLEAFPLDVDTAWLLGLYVAEGSAAAANGGAQLSLGGHEDAIAARASAIVRRLGFAGTITRPAGRNVQMVAMGGPILRRALEDWCGRGAPNKRIPSFIMEHGDLGLVHSFLDGLVQGDAHVATRRRRAPNSLRVSSRALVAQLRVLLARLGIGYNGSVSRQRPRQINGHDLPCNKVYSIGWTWTPSVTTRQLNGRAIRSWSHRWRPVPEGIVVPVQSVTVEPFKGTVYNFETSDHTYIADGVLTHNCDAAINYHLAKQDIKLPEGAIYPLPEHEGWNAERIYDAIKRAVDEQQTAGNQGEGDDEIGGYPNPGDEPTPGGGCAPQGEPDEQERRTLEREWRQVAAQAASVARTAGQHKGSTLADLTTIPASKIHWAAVVRRGTTMALAAHGNDESSWQRRGRRSGRVGPQFPGYVTRKARLAVVIDTSASMSDDELAQCVTETVAASRASGVPIYLVTHDTAVQYKGWISPNRQGDVQDAIIGRGGTSAYEAYQAVEDVRGRFDVFVHLTDCGLRWPAWPVNTRKRIIARTDEDGWTPEGCQVIDVGVG